MFKRLSTLASAVLCLAFTAIVPSARGDLDAQGWTVIPPGTGVWVSKQGSDTTGNGTQAKPYATPAKALANSSGATDIILGSGNWPAITGWTRSGTVVDPVVVMTWPGQDRAVIDGGFATKAGAVIHNLWLVDLEIRAGAADFPLDLLGSGSNILVEGCLLTGKMNVRVQGYSNAGGNPRWKNVRFNRTAVMDIPSKNGVYVQGVDGFEFRESAVVRTGTLGNLLDQGLYVHQSCGPGTSTIVGSIFAYPAAGALQMRNGGLGEDLFVIGGGVGIQPGHNETANVEDGNVAAYKANATIRNCVVTQGRNIGTEPRGHAYWIENCGIVTVENCLAVKGGGSQPIPFLVGRGSKAILIGNLVVDYALAGQPTVVVSGGAEVTQTSNDFTKAVKGSPTPNISLGSIAGSLGGVATEDGFWSIVRTQSKKSWKGVTGSLVCARYREAYGRATVVPPVEPPVVVPPVEPPTVPPIETTSQVSVAQVGEYVVLVIAGKKPTPEQLAKIQEAVLGVLN